MGDGPGTDGVCLLVFSQQILTQQILIGLILPVPKVLDADVAWADIAIDRFVPSLRDV